MKAGAILGLLLLAIPAGAATVGFDAAADPFEPAAAFRVVLDLPVAAARGVTLGAGYDQRSFWTFENDGGNDRVETDFAPSVVLSRRHGTWTWAASYLHQSNGRLDAASRSWNRAVGRVTRHGDRWRASLALWAAFRVEDTNPDLRRTVGDGELVLAATGDGAWGGEAHLGFTFDPLDGTPLANATLRFTRRLPERVFPGGGVRALAEVRWGRGESLARNEEITRVLRVGLRVTR